MLAVYRFRIPGTAADDLVAGLAEAHEVLGRQRGYVSGHLGRNIDEPELWLLQTQWENVGSYRRALSSSEVKLKVWPVLAHAIEEASAFEIVGAEGPELNRVEPRSLG